MVRFVFVRNKKSDVGGAGIGDAYYDGTDLYIDNNTNQYIDDVPKDYFDGTDLYVDEAGNQYIEAGEGT